jgi:enoyl-CoA hydratase/carnithine racemase
MLQVEQEGRLVVLTLDDPAHRNAQTPSLWSALADVGRGLGPEVGVVLIRGAGPSFSAGLDRRMFAPEGVPGETSLPVLAGSGAAALEESIGRFQDGFTVWSSVRAVTVAAVQGHAIGAGFQLALACDLRIAADDVAFSMKETSLGLVPDLGGTSPLVRQVGYARALEICATGRFVHAEEAVRLGLVQLAVPADHLDPTTRDQADAILEAPEAALRELKPLLRNAVDAPRAEQCAAERAAQARLLTALVAERGK